jgi:hypothetical protein
MLVMLCVGCGESAGPEWMRRRRRNRPPEQGIKSIWYIVAPIQPALLLLELPRYWYRSPVIYATTIVMTCVYVELHLL